MATQCKDHATFNHLLPLIIKWKHITFYYQMHPKHRKLNNWNQLSINVIGALKKMRGELCPSLVLWLPWFFQHFTLQKFLEPLVLSIFDTCGEVSIYLDIEPTSICAYFRKPLSTMFTIYIFVPRIWDSCETSIPNVLLLTWDILDSLPCTLHKCALIES